MITYKIGDTCPGGGIVFKIQGTIVYEAVFFPGRTDWYHAMQMVSSYKGGGYTDWSLPSRAELEWMLHNMDFDFDRIWPYDDGFDPYYWSGEEYTDDRAFICAEYRINSELVYDIKAYNKDFDAGIVCAVRAF